MKYLLVLTLMIMGCDNNSPNLQPPQDAGPDSEPRPEPKRENDLWWIMLMG